MIGDCILWPSLGNPAVVSPHQDGSSEVRMVLATTQSFESRLPLLGRLLPVAQRGGLTQIHLEWLQCHEFVPSSHDARWAPWIIENATYLYEVVFRTQPGTRAGQERPLLCDIHLQAGSLQLYKPNAVYLDARAAHAPRTVFIATDIHVASRWETIVADARRVLSDVEREMPGIGSTGSDIALERPSAWDAFQQSFVNPNKNLAALIRIVNHLADEGRADFLFLTGDLVDFKFQRPRRYSRATYDGTEWQFLEDLLLGRLPFSERLRVPMFTLTGNHDYRLFPYRLQTYGLRHCGVADKLLEELLRRTGGLARLKYKPSDWDAVRVRQTSGHSLDYYHLAFNPYLDYSINISGVSIIVLDTGPDFFTDVSNLFSRTVMKFLRELVTAIGHPSSNGFTDGQLRFVSTRCHDRSTEGGILLVTHAPLLNPRPGETRDPLVPIGECNRASGPETAKVWRRRHLQKEIRSKRLDYQTVFHRQAEMLDCLCDIHGQGVVLSGHVHRQLEFAVEKATGQVSQGAYSGRAKSIEEDRVYLLQTPSLGHIERDTDELNIPGYRQATLAGGRIQEVILHRLSAVPPECLYHWSVVSREPEEERIAIEFFDDEAKSFAAGRRIRRIAVVAAAAPHGWRDGMNLQVNPAQALRDGVHVVDAPEGCAWVFSVNDVTPIEVLIQGKRRGVAMRFFFETLVQLHAGVLISKGVVEHHRSLR